MTDRPGLEPRVGNAATLVVNNDAVLIDGFAPSEMKLVGAQLPERVLPRIQFRNLINGVISYAIDLADGRADFKF